jgi:FkbM family methyltransferase
MTVSPWIVLDSVHGRFIVNRFCSFVADHIVKTGRTHIESEIAALVGMASTLPDGCVIVDAGASHGLISVPLARAVKARDGVVHSFEIQKPFYQALCGTALLNDLPNLIPHHHGLGNCFEMKKMPAIDYSKPQDFGLVSFRDETYPSMDRVEVATLDSQQFGRLDLLKIDVEGHEFEVLTGARRCLVEFQPWVWCEFFLSDVLALKSCFDGLNYSFFKMDPQNILCAPAKRLAESGIKVEAEEM